MKPGKSIEWWNDNVKRGDIIEMDVSGDDPNFWVFSSKKGGDIYFDEVSYPSDDLKQYFKPSPKFQRKKEDIGKKESGFIVELDNIRIVRTINGEPVKKSTVRPVSPIPNNTVSRSSSSFSSDIREVNGRWVCPCYNPDEPSKFSYSQKGHAVWNHKKHIQS